MPPTIHLVRHAEGLHNLGQEYWSLVDPPLTEKGRQQCLQLRNDFPFHATVELVVSSPLTRAITSAVEGFRPVFQRRPEQSLVLLPDVQEIGDFPCDIGCGVEELKEKLADLGVSVDYSHVDDAWNGKDGRYKPVLEAIIERARAARKWLCRREEKEIVVVSHGAFAHFLTEDWEDGYIEEATGWKNAEYRTYSMQVSDAEEVSMSETVQSRQRRAKTGRVPPAEEQTELRKKALQVWEEQGYLR